MASTPLNKQPALIEIIGPTGVGKTTLTHDLLYQNGQAVQGRSLQIGSLRHAPFCIKQAFFLLPTVFRLIRNGRWLTREEFKRMIFLKGWHRVLERQRLNHDGVIILDQAPVFYLATLHSFGPQELKGEKHAKWWDFVFRQWASMVDMVVWLDAPDAILIDRVCSRAKPHFIKGMSPTEAHRFLATYRSSFERVISELTARAHIEVLCFDTSRQPLEAIAGQVLCALGGEIVNHKASGLFDQ